MLDLIRESGVASSTFYSYFASKEQVFNLCYRSAHSDLEFDLRRSILQANEVVPRWRFQAAFTALLEFWLHAPDATELLVRTLRKDLDRESEKLPEVPEALSEALDDLSRSGDTEPLPGAALAAFTWGVFGTAVRWGDQLGNALEEPAVVALERLCWKALAPHATELASDETTGPLARLLAVLRKQRAVESQESFTAA